MKTGMCPGCQKTKQLVSSHLVSRAVYDYLRTDQLHPIIVGGGKVRATTDQLQAELLCNDCEQILNRGGEQWMVGKLCTFNRQFPLYDTLHRQPPIDTDPDGETFAARTNPDIDVQRISRPAAAQIIMNPPYETTLTGCHTYLFHVPGILFRLSVGKQIPTPEKTQLSAFA